MAAFAELGLCPELVRSVEEQGWGMPTPVQQEAIPLILGGGDVLAAAETGSGKTGAFALPVLQITHEALREAQQMQQAGPEKRAKRVTPTHGPGIGDDRDGLLAVSPDGLECKCGSANAWAGGRASVGVSGGAYYFEVQQMSEGLCRIGWSSLSAKLALGTDAFGFGFGGTGKKSHAGKFDSYGEAYGSGDTVGCALDRARGLISYYKNGHPLGAAFEIPPALQRQPLFPAICLKGCSVRLVLSGPMPSLPEGAAPVADVAPADAASNAAGAAERDDTAAADGRCPTAVILEPARDLCEQVHGCVVEFARFFSDPPIRAALFVGGVDAGGQMKALKGGVDIVSGTPGRLMDLVQSGKLHLGEARASAMLRVPRIASLVQSMASQRARLGPPFTWPTRSPAQVQFFILDEADRLLDTGNLETISKLHAKLPKRGRSGGRLQTLLFSATLHTADVRALAERITSHPTFVDLKGKDSVPETVHHVVVSVDAQANGAWTAPPLPVPTDEVHRADAVALHLKTKESMSEGTKRLKPLVLLEVVEKLKMSQCIVFCRTNLDCDHLEKFLNNVGGGKGFRGKAEKGKENPYSCVVLAGMRSMEERRASLRAFKEGDVRFMICTDVAARGLDIKELPYVINMTLPDKEEDYVHRVGRVGRADVMGLAISLVWYYDKRKWEGKQLSTKLASEGGCCIWYNEPALLRAIEARLGAPIEPLGAFLAKQPNGVQGLSAYGQARDGGLNEASSAHLSELAPTVGELAALEVRAQHSFLFGLREVCGLLPTAPVSSEEHDREDERRAGTGAEEGEAAGRKGSRRGGGGGRHPRARGGGGKGSRTAA